MTPFLEQLRLAGMVAAPVCGFLGAILKQQLRILKQGRAIHERQHHDLTEALLFGTFLDGDHYTLRYDGIGRLNTSDFGEKLFKLIQRWNDKPSPPIIIPKDADLAYHLRWKLAMEASIFLNQCERIDCYWQMEEKNTMGAYVTATFAVCLMRPDAPKIRCPDTPRIAIIGQTALEHILMGEVRPYEQDHDSAAFLEVLHCLAEKVRDEQFAGIELMECPVK